MPSKSRNGENLTLSIATVVVRTSCRDEVRRGRSLSVAIRPVILGVAPSGQAGFG